jgi:hypothetical protein
LVQQSKGRFTRSFFEGEIVRKKASELDQKISFQMMGTYSNGYVLDKLGGEV